MKPLLPWRWPSRKHARQRIRLTRGGVWFVVGTLLIGMAAVDSDINLLLLIFGFCFGGIMLSALWGWRGLRRLSVTRLPPEVLIAGQASEIRYLLSSARRWGSIRGIHLIDTLPVDSPLDTPEAYIPLLRPGESLTVRVAMHAQNRGRVNFVRIRLTSSFPFSVFTKSVDFPSEQTTVVFPALGRIVGNVMTSTRSTDATGAGVGIAQRTGDEEYYGVREYRMGDNPRRIHWRRSARTGQLMIREMSKSREQQLWCVVDTFMPPDAGEISPNLEQAISACATLICEALERGVRVGLICTGQPLVILPPGGGRAHRPRLLRELALLETTKDEALSVHIKRLSWPTRWRGPCVLFGPRQCPDLRATAVALHRAIGSATSYVPHTPAFERLFSFSQPDAPADNAVQTRLARQPMFAQGAQG